jgi:glycosyltransferase involved in cell wall biosynthesis
MGKHILWVTIFPETGGGYKVISAPICEKLQQAGHQVKVLGLDYTGGEHHYEFSIIPMQTMGDVLVAINNLRISWGIDLVVCASEIPMCAYLLGSAQVKDLPVVVITPMENGPLIRSVAEDLSAAKKVFFISKFAVEEASKVGLESEWLPVSPDPIFVPATPDAKSAVRKALGFDEDDLIILTVAENQERKNIPAAMQIVSSLVRNIADRKVKYVLVSTEYHPTRHTVGNRLMELAQDTGILGNFILFEKGMPTDKLKYLYQISDVFLLTSKAEGLGLPILEAMACGLTVVGTDTGAISELLAGGRGYPVIPEYSMTDVWMNSRRDFIGISDGIFLVMEAVKYPTSWEGIEYTQSLRGVGPELFLNYVETL